MYSHFITIIKIDLRQKTKTQQIGILNNRNEFTHVGKIKII